MCVRALLCVLTLSFMLDSLKEHAAAFLLFNCSILSNVVGIIWVVMKER